MRLCVVAVVLVAACKPPSGNATLTVDVTAGGHPISPLMFGDQVEIIDIDPFWDAEAQAPRAEVLALTAEAGVTILRYPGGTPSDFFHWAEVLGPVEQRSPQINPFTPNLDRVPVSFGPDEFAQVASQLGVEMLITANVGTGTAEEAAGWLQHYRNTGASARYWEIGNEVWIVGEDLAARTQRKTPEEYAALFNDYARALRAVDPEVKIGVLGCHDTGAFPLCEEADWNARVFAQVTERFDFVAVHNSYAPAAAEPFMSDQQTRLFRAMLAAPEYLAANFELQRQELRTHAAEFNREAPFAITEHAALFVPVSDPTFVRQLERNRNLASALFSAASFNVWLARPDVVMAQHLKLASGYWQAPVEMAAGDPMSGAHKGAYFHVLRLYRDAAGGQVIPIEVECDATFDSESVALVPAQQDVPALHAIAVIPPSGPDRLWLYVVNRDLERAVEAQLAVGGFTPVEMAADVLNAAEAWSLNGTETPETVKVTSAAVSGLDRFSFPAHSLTRLRIR